MAETNIKAENLINWKNRLDRYISRDLVKSLQLANEDAKKLYEVTASEDDDNLHYRFNDLVRLTEEAAKQLTSFVNSFDTELSTYINTVKAAEKEAEEKIKEKIDQFAESAAKISKLKM